MYEDLKASGARNKLKRGRKYLSRGAEERAAPEYQFGQVLRVDPEKVWEWVTHIKQRRGSHE